MAGCFLDTSVTSSAVTLYVGDRRILSVTFASTSFFRQFSSPDTVFQLVWVAALTLSFSWCGLQPCHCLSAGVGCSPATVFQLVWVAALPLSFSWCGLQPCHCLSAGVGCSPATVFQLVWVAALTLSFSWCWLQP